MITLAADETISLLPGGPHEWEARRIRWSDGCVLEVIGRVVEDGAGEFLVYRASDGELIWKSTALEGTPKGLLTNCY